VAGLTLATAADSYVHKSIDLDEFSRGIAMRVEYWLMLNENAR
jgi:hypothetical protein